MRAILDRSDELCRWVAANIPEMYGRPFPESATAIGVEDGSGSLLGAVAYSNWQPDHGTIQASAYAIDPRWLMARSALDTIFRYAFETCGCHKIWAATAHENGRTLKFLAGLGFECEAVLQHQLGIGHHTVLSSIFRWDYVRSPYGKAMNPARKLELKARLNGRKTGLPKAPLS